MDSDRVYCEDCMETMSRMGDGSIDLIVTSPPYNKGAYSTKKGDSVSWGAYSGRRIHYDGYSDDMMPSDYEAWQREVIGECVRVLKPHGSLFYVHKDILFDGLLVSPKWVYDFQVHQQIVWNRGSSMSNNPRYFQPITEYIYWIVKNPKELYFDKGECLFKKSIWDIGFDINTGHPAPFPERLVGNIVLGCSRRGDVVYDPFCGSGTTLKVAYDLGRRYIGSEISERYVDMAEARIGESRSRLRLFDD